MGNLLFIGSENCSEVGGAMMVLVALGIIMIPIVAIMGIGIFKRMALLLMAGGIAWMGVCIYSFSNSTSAAGAYTDIFAIMGITSIVFAFVCFSSPFWIREKPLPVERDPDEPSVDFYAVETVDERQSKWRKDRGLRIKDKDKE